MAAWDLEEPHLKISLSLSVSPTPTLIYSYIASYKYRLLGITLWRKNLFSKLHSHNSWIVVVRTRLIYFFLSCYNWIFHSLERGRVLSVWPRKKRKKMTWVCERPTVSPNTLFLLCPRWGATSVGYGLGCMRVGGHGKGGTCPGQWTPYLKLNLSMTL